MSNDQTDPQNENQPLLNQLTVPLYSEYTLPLPEHSYTSDFNDTEIQGIRSKKIHIKLLVYSIFLLLVFLAFFFVTNSILIYPQIQQLINQSSEFQINKVSLAQINTKGLGIRVQGVNTIDYDRIQDGYISNLFKIGTGMFKDVSINLQNVNLEIMIEDKLEAIGEVEIPEFKVDVTNKAVTNLDFIIITHPNTLKIMKLLKYVFSHPEEVLKFYGDTNVKVKLGGIYLGKYPINFSQSIVGKQYFKLEMDELTVNNIQLNKGGSILDPVYDLVFQLSIPNPILNNMISFVVPELQWQLFVGDCDQKATIPIFSDNFVKSGGFKLSSHENFLSTNISTSLEKLNDNLLKECSMKDDDDSSKTPIMILMDQVLNNKSIPLKIKNKGGSKTYPSVINDLLGNFDFNLNYNPNFEASKLIHNVSIDNLGFEFENGDINNPIINGNINIFIEIPVTGLSVDDFKIPKIKGLPKLIHQNVKFAEIPLKEWHECQNEIVQEMDSDEVIHDYFHLQFKIYREPVIIKDSSMFGKVINEILYRGKSRILIDCLLDMMLNVAVFDNRDIIVNKINIQSESDITRGDLFQIGNV